LAIKKTYLDPTQPYEISGFMANATKKPEWSLNG